MTEHINSPTREPSETLLRDDQRASIALRHQAYSAARLGVPLALAEAEVRFAYDLASKR